MLNEVTIMATILKDAIMAEAEAEKYQEENAANKAAVAARRAETAKKAAKVAAEAAKFEKKGWQRPQKWEYEEAKAPVQDDGHYSHHAYTLNRRTEGISFIELHHKRGYDLPEEECVSLEEVVKAIAKAELYAIAAETAVKLLPHHIVGSHTNGYYNYPTDPEMIRRMCNVDVKEAADEANYLGAEWEATHGRLPIINSIEFFGGRKKFFNTVYRDIIKDAPQWLRDAEYCEEIISASYDLVFCD